MSLIFKIAWRNILRHKGKSLVIGAIIFLGSLIMTMGNGVISGMDKGLQENIVNGFMGDIVVVANEQKEDNVLLEMMGKPVEPLYNFSSIDSVLGKSNSIDNYMPVGKNLAMLLNEEGGDPTYAYILGVDFKKYRQMFPGNIKILKGTIPQNGETGVMVSKKARTEFFEFTGLWAFPENSSFDSLEVPEEYQNKMEMVFPKDNLVFMGFNEENTATDVRTPVKAIYQYKALNNLWGYFLLMDINSFRKSQGYFDHNDAPVKLTQEQNNLLSDANPEDLFSDDAMFSTTEVKQTAKQTADTTATANIQQKTQTEAIYNMVFVKTKKGENLDKVLLKINDSFKQQKIEARAISWKKAAGPIGSMAVLIKSALFTFVMLLFLVAIIIIMNTLSMAALERTAEIGMMRAIGAKKSFISSMFIGETFILSFIFGLIGIFTGMIAVKITSMQHITTDNEILQLFFGGDYFNPLLNMQDIALALIQLMIVTVIAIVYPVFVSRGITPLDAITRE